jgi:hypothetical protein
MTPKQGIAFVKRHGIVLQAARGPVPSLAETIVGEPIRGSWWAHSKGGEIYRVADAISGSDDVLVCKLVDGKVTYVHRRLWPALVKLAARFPKDRLARIWDEHTDTGAHRSRSLPFPDWVPTKVLRDAKKLPEAAARALLSRYSPSEASEQSEGGTKRPRRRAPAASASLSNRSRQVEPRKRRGGSR